MIYMAGFNQIWRLVTSTVEVFLAGLAANKQVKNHQKAMVKLNRLNRFIADYQRAGRSSVL
jgi:hypothetical protein